MACIWLDSPLHHRTIQEGLRLVYGKISSDGGSSKWLPMWVQCILFSVVIADSIAKECRAHGACYILVRLLGCEIAKGQGDKREQQQIARILDSGVWVWGEHITA